MLYIIYIYIYIHTHTLCYTWALSSVQSLSRVRLFATPWTVHTRLPCPSPTPGAYSNSCRSSWWCHPTISFSVVTFSSCLQSFPASGSFQMNESVLCIMWPKYWSFNFSISPSNEYSGLISFRMNLLAVQGTLKSLLQLSRVFSNTTVQKHQFFGAQTSF